MLKEYLTKLQEKLCFIFSRYEFGEPIFIIAPPRSGSTLLFECLTQFKGLFYIPNEADFAWWRQFPYEKMKHASDYVSARYASPQKISSIRMDLYREAILNYLKKAKALKNIDLFLRRRKYRYLDKTIANCFHLEFLNRIFPDAQYIFMVRDPRANISSMIEGWLYIERFGKPQLTSEVCRLKSKTIQHWTYPAPPGWQNIIHAQLPEICAWSWKQHIEFALDFFNRESLSSIMVKYEELVDSPIHILEYLSDKLHLKLSGKVKKYFEIPSISRTTVSFPYNDKWKTKNYSQIIKIMPMIEDTATKLGYNLNL